MPFVDPSERLLLRRSHAGGVSPLRARGLPLLEASWKIRDPAAMQNPHPAGEGSKQRPVVAHQNHRAIEALDRVFQRLDRLDVQVISRLIEQQQVGSREHHHRQCHSRPLAAGESAGLAEHRVTGEAEAAQVSLHGAPAPGRAQLIDELVERAIARYLCQVLPVVSHLDRVGYPHLSRVWLPLAHECSKQGGFPRAIGADQPDHVTPPHPGRELIEQHPVTDANPDLLRHQHLVAATGVRLQAQRHGALLARRWAQATDPSQAAAAGPWPGRSSARRCCAG